MELEFYKYHGTGNDFIMFDFSVKDHYLFSSKQVEVLCNRHFGIGADGLIILKKGTEGAAFDMVYYNSDGREGSMCGNGGRCAVSFALHNGIFKGSMVVFNAFDGKHFAEIDTKGIVSLKMSDVNTIGKNEDDFILDTGSPHYVKFVQDNGQLNVNTEGRKIRNSEKFIHQGINVNFVDIRPDGLWVRTYERGVENETLSCGTGVTASVLAEHSMNPSQSSFVRKVETPGGSLTVKANYQKGKYSNIFLCGPAVQVFRGYVNL